MQTVQAIDRAFEILEIMSAEPNIPWTVSSLAEATEMKRSTASRIIRTMNDKGYLESTGRKSGYVLGARFVQLSRNYKDTNLLRRVATPLLRDFHREFDEFICISVLISYKRYVVHREERSDKTFRKGYLLPLVENPCRSVSGRLLLLGLPRDVQERVFLKFGVPGDDWPEVTSRETFFAALDRIALNEVYIEYRDGNALISIPISDCCGRISSVLGSHLPEKRFAGERREQILAALKSISRKIEKSAVI